MDNHQIVDLIMQNKWWALAAVVVGLVVRALKSDGPIPICIPPRFRPWLAIVLGVFAAAFEKVNAGIPWRQALVGGVLASILAIAGHQLFIESVRNGKELGSSNDDQRPRT
jgi:hypothetical protein